MTRGRPPHDDLLTPAEWRIVHWVRHGLSNPQIAARCRISANGVKFHISNALGKLGLPDRRALRTWTGFPKAFESGDTIGASMRTNGVAQIARTVSDLEASIEWYEKVLDLTHLYTFGDMGFLAAGEVRLMLNQVDTVAEESYLYFRVPSLRDQWDEIAASAKVANAPHLIHTHDDGTEEWLAFIEDPDGRMVGLMTQVAARS